METVRSVHRLVLRNSVHTVKYCADESTFHLRPVFLHETHLQLHADATVLSDTADTAVTRDCAQSDSCGLHIARPVRRHRVTALSVLFCIVLYCSRASPRRAAAMRSFRSLREGSISARLFVYLLVTHLLVSYWRGCNIDVESTCGVVCQWAPEYELIGPRTVQNCTVRVSAAVQYNEPHESSSIPRAGKRDTHVGAVGRCRSGTPFHKWTAETWRGRRLLRCLIRYTAVARWSTRRAAAASAALSRASRAHLLRQRQRLAASAQSRRNRLVRPTRINRRLTVRVYNVFQYFLSQYYEV